MPSLATECGRSGRPAEWYPDGCYAMIRHWLLERLHMLGLAALGAVFVQVRGESSWRHVKQPLKGQSFDDIVFRAAKIRIDNLL